MRIAVAEIAQETDSFSPMIAELADFEAFGLYFGDEILERMRGVGPIGGMMHVAAEHEGPLELVPLVRAWGGAGGTISAKALDFLTDRLIAGLKAALPVDAIYLALHGAAASETEDDVEGHVLSAVRELVGSSIPVAVCLDHHANITTRMVQHADVLIGHETQPHDPVATGRKTARVMFGMLRGEIQPTIAWRKIPMITPQDQFLTSQGPMKEWFDLAREMERLPGVIDVSPYPMQPWLDVAEGGWAVVAHTDNNQKLAESLADESAAKAWGLREQFWRSDRVAPAEAVRQAVAADRGLIILSDTGDSVYGGSPGESTCILRELLAQQLPCPALVPIVDSEVVDVAISSGLAARITVDLGGKVDRVFNWPVRVTGRVAAVSNGVMLELQDRGACDLGRCALLEVGQIRIVVLERRTFAINHPVLYTHMGLEIADARMVVVKTASNFQFFSRWRTGLIRVDSPGTTQSDLTAFEWKRVPRPIYPLDDLNHWQPGESKLK
ncbi:MAG TPA: M81 family metallopeptidase [Planctomycetaceae bacterium]|jgi:microcystin degradation protein MlrC